MPGWSSVAPRRSAGWRPSRCRRRCVGWPASRRPGGPGSGQRPDPGDGAGRRVFRERLAVQARAVVPEAGVELDAGDADSIDAAALAWLERPDGWQDVVTRAAASGRAREEEAAARARDERADRLQRRLDDATDELEGGTAEGTRRPRLVPCRATPSCAASWGSPGARPRTRSRQPTRCAVRRRRRVPLRRTAQAAAEAELRRLRARIDRAGAAGLVGAQRERRMDRDGPASGRGCCSTPWSTRPPGSRELGLPTVEGAPGRPGRRRRGRRRAPGVVGGVVAAGRRPGAARPAACAAAGAPARRRLQRDQDRLARGRPRRAARAADRRTGDARRAHRRRADRGVRRRRDRRPARWCISRAACGCGSPPPA